MLSRSSSSSELTSVTLTYDPRDARPPWVPPAGTVLAPRNAETKQNEDMLGEL